MIVLPIRLYRNEVIRMECVKTKENSMDWTAFDLALSIELLPLEGNTNVFVRHVGRIKWMQNACCNIYEYAEWH